LQNDDFVKMLIEYKINYSKKMFIISEQQKINALSLFSLENKIIYLNDCFRYLSVEEKNILTNKILPIVSKKNFVINGISLNV
jgi:hypothetical protein